MEKQGSLSPIQVPISKNYKKEQFFHYLDMSELNLSPGESIEHTLLFGTMMD